MVTCNGVTPYTGNMLCKDFLSSSALGPIIEEMETEKRYFLLSDKKMNKPFILSGATKKGIDAYGKTL